MSTVKANTLEPASGGTITITGAALTTPALGTPASGTLTNCTGLPASAVVNTPSGGISATTVQAALNELDTEKFDKTGNALTPGGGTLAVTGNQTVSGTLKSTGNLFVNTSTPITLWSGSSTGLTVKATGSNAANITASCSNAANITVEMAASYGVNVGVFLAKGDATYPPIQMYQVNGSTYRLAWQWDASGNFVPGTDNAFSVGDGSARASVIHAGTGTISTSDARAKTLLRAMTPAELACAVELATTGPGVFQFLDAVEKKGADKARLHVGYTVQGVVAVMERHGLDPARYAFICYDAWDQQVVEHPAVEARPAVEAKPAVYAEQLVDIVIRNDGQDIRAQRPVLVEAEPAVQAQPAVEAREAWTEVVREAGDRWGFRPDQLDRWIQAGLNQALIAKAGL